MVGALDSDRNQRSKASFLTAEGWEGALARPTDRLGESLLATRRDHTSWVQVGRGSKRKASIHSANCNPVLAKRNTKFRA